MATKYLSGLILLFATFSALADDTTDHQADQNTAAIEDNRLRILSNNEEDRTLDAGIALANSLSAHQYDFNHDGVQASVAAGGFRGESGFSFGFAIKPSDNTLLNFQGGYSSNNDEGASMALNIKF